MFLSFFLSCDDMFIEVVFSRGAAEERRLKMLVSLDSPRRRVRIDPVYCRFYSQSRNSKRTAARKASCRLAAVRLLSRRTRQGASPSRQTMGGGVFGLQTYNAQSKCAFPNSTISDAVSFAVSGRLSIISQSTCRNTLCCSIPFSLPSEMHKNITTYTS